MKKYIVLVFLLVLVYCTCLIKNFNFIWTLLLFEALNAQEVYERKESSFRNKLTDRSDRREDEYRHREKSYDRKDLTRKRRNTFMSTPFGFASMSSTGGAMSLPFGTVSQNGNGGLVSSGFGYTDDAGTSYMFV